jgi:hypothetical protein
MGGGVCHRLFSFFYRLLNLFFLESVSQDQQRMPPIPGSFSKAAPRHLSDVLRMALENAP